MLTVSRSDVKSTYYKGKLLSALTAVLHSFRKLLIWDRTSCGLVYVYHTSL